MDLKNFKIEDITLPHEDAKFLFKFWKMFFNTSGEILYLCMVLCCWVYHVHTDEKPNHFSQMLFGFNNSKWECCSAPFCNWSTVYHITHVFSNFFYVLYLASSKTVKSCSREGRAYEGCRDICWFSGGNKKAGDRSELLIEVKRKAFVMILPLEQLAVDNRNNLW